MVSKKRLAIVVLALGVLGLAFALIMMRAASATPDFLTPPSPNGYELLLNAASKAQGPDPSRVTNNVDAFLQENSASLALLREAVKHPAELPATYYSPNNTLLHDLPVLRQLARIARIKGQQHEKAGQWDRAADCYLDIIRMGHQVQRGPMISGLMGFSIEHTGLEALDALAPRLSAEKRQMVAGDLAQIHAAAVTMDDLRRRELHFIRRTSPIPTPIIRLLPGVRKAFLTVEGKINKIRADLEATRLKLLSPPSEKVGSLKEACSACGGALLSGLEIDPDGLDSPAKLFHHYGIHSHAEAYLVRVLEASRTGGGKNEMEIKATIVERIEGTRHAGDALVFRRVSDGDYDAVSRSITELPGRAFYVFLAQWGEGQVAVDAQNPQALWDYTDDLREVAELHRRTCQPTIGGVTQ